MEFGHRSNEPRGKWSNNHRTVLETAIFHTPMRVALDVISQHFRTNLLRALFVPNKTIFSKREQEVMDKTYCRLK